MMGARRMAGTGRECRGERGCAAIFQEEVGVGCRGGLCVVGVSGSRPKKGKTASVGDVARVPPCDSPDEVTRQELHVVARDGPRDRRTHQGMYRLPDVT